VPEFEHHCQVKGRVATNARLSRTILASGGTVVAVSLRMTYRARMLTPLAMLVATACGGETSHSMEGPSMAGTSATGGAIGTAGTSGATIGGSSSAGGDGAGTGGGVGVSCCASDADCTSSAPPCVKGECRGAINLPGCWRDADCTSDELCSGVSLCTCGVQCGVVEKWGTCVPAHAGCCASDADCANGGECVAGVCKSSSPSGSCWSNSDCSGGTCRGAQICPCPSACFAADTAGTCVPFHVP
jgi:hypothetical protein